MKYDVFRPDPRWGRYTADLIVRMSKIDPAQIKHVEINCGSGGELGWVILQDESRVRV